jgi:hypothetical protein
MGQAIRLHRAIQLERWAINSRLKIGELGSIPVKEILGQLHLRAE